MVKLPGYRNPTGPFIVTSYRATTLSRWIAIFGTNFDQFTEIDLSASQETYVEVLSQGVYVGGERAARQNFYTRVIPAEAVRADAIRRLYGGS